MSDEAMPASAMRVIRDYAVEITELRAEVERLRAELANSQELAGVLHDKANRLGAEVARLREAVAAAETANEQLRSVLRAVKADRPSAHSDRVWEQILTALDPAVTGGE